MLASFHFFSPGEVMSLVQQTVSKKALIFGISGQDGGYLAQLLLHKGYEIHGTSRDCENNPFRGLKRLGLLDRIKLYSAALTDFRSVVRVLNQVRPDEVYNLAGQTSVALSFQQPVEAFESISVGTINILECARLLDHPVRIFNAASSECFGNTKTAADEETPFRPRSPYAMAKAAAFWTVANYREAYGMHACSGILFNHESPLRPQRFVTQKIITAVVSIAAGQPSKLRLGNLDVKRDWGWAPEYVEAIWLMLQQSEPIDFVIATGRSHELREFVELAFKEAGLNWTDHVEHDETLLRPSDLERSVGNPEKILRILGWRAKFGLHEIVHRLIAEQRLRDKGDK